MTLSPLHVPNQIHMPIKQQQGNNASYINQGDRVELSISNALLSPLISKRDEAENVETQNFVG